jgi:multimeric flavodoxin WrbA
MAKEISKKISEPHELRLLRLSDYELKPCKGCYACLFRDEGCVLKDDYSQIVDELLAADAYIVASPTYFLGPNSVLKSFLDRGLALYPHAEKLWGRPAVAVGIAGIEGSAGYTQLGLESFLKMLLADVKGTRIVYGALPGEIFFKEEGKIAAAELAEALFGEALKEEEPCCPVCGGKTFRFLSDSALQCMLCSNSGTISASGGGFQIEIQEGEHQMFTSLSAAVAHREWLRGMKRKFIENKARLKEVCVAYIDDDSWVKVKPNRDK